MAERFSIGEIAILVLKPGEAAHPKCVPYVGQEVEIVSGLDKRSWSDGSTYAAYIVQSQDGRRFGAQPAHLRKKRLPPPREELGEWDLCPWRPERQPETVSGKP